MLTIRQIEDTVHNLMADKFSGMLSYPASVLADAAAKALHAVNDEDRKRVEKETELILQAQDDLFYSRGKVYPKTEFFKGMTFRVIPTAAELEKAILLPGAAFMPFVTDECFADSYTLKDEDGTAYGTMEVSLRFGDVAPAFLMLGNSGIIDYLSAESEENRILLRGARSPENLTVRLTAFDLGAFYRKYSVVAGDALVVRVDDWENGEFTVSVQKNEPSGEERRLFVQDLEQALLRVCETERDYLEIPQQISEAYLFAFENGKDLRRRPHLSLEEYRHCMNEIGIRRDGSEWLLVPADELDTPGAFEQSLLKNRAASDAAMAETDHECCHHHAGEPCSCGHEHEDDADPGKSLRTIDPDISPDGFAISTGTLESIDAILAELNAPVNSVELGAMIFDSLANGEEDFENFRSRTMDFLGLTFSDDAQETAFINFLEDSWEIAKEYFNPAEDAMRAPLRTRLLDLTRARIEYSLMLLEKNAGKKVPEKTANRIAAIHRNITETLAILNSSDRIDDDSRYEQLELRIGDIEDAWDDFTGQ